jgi:pantoate kinase
MTDVDEDKIYVGSIGIKIRLESGLTVEQLAEATSVEINVLRQADGTEDTWAATIEGTKIVHTTELGDLPEGSGGHYKLQSVYNWGAGNTTRGNTADMKVYEEFE